MLALVTSVLYLVKVVRYFSEVGISWGEVEGQGPLVTRQETRTTKQTRSQYIYLSIGYVGNSDRRK